MRPFESKMVIVGLFVSLLVCSCKGERGSLPAGKPEPQKTAPVAAKPAAASAVGEQLLAELPKYVYETIGRRDPFEPLASDRPASLIAGEQENTPLQQFGAEQFRLIGVIVGKGQPAAMVAAPDGKGYVLRKGIKIGKNNGVVTEINTSAVVVEEQYQDFSGNILKNQLELKLIKREGAK